MQRKISAKIKNAFIARGGGRMFYCFVESKTKNDREAESKRISKKVKVTKYGFTAQLL